MLWRWFQEWREQRAALADLRRRAREDEAALADRDPNPIQLATFAVRMGELDVAAERWEQARVLLPNLVRTSHDSLDVLLALERYDEAEAMMLEGRRRHRFDRFYRRGLALVAERRGDYREAFKRWKAVRSFAMDRQEAFVHGGICLMALGQIEKAEKLFKAATLIEPDEIDAWVELARISDGRKDWPESLIHWKRLADRFDYSPGFAGHANALAELGRLDEAEDYLRRVLLDRPFDFNAVVSFARIARRRGDLAAECERWASVRRMDARFPPAYRDGARCLFELGNDEAAEAVLNEAIERWANEAWPYHDLARIAHDRKNWDEAASRWQRLRQLFPAEEAGYTLGVEALRAAGRGDEASVLTADVVGLPAHPAK